MRDMNSDDSHLLWEDIEEEALFDTRLFSIQSVHRRSAAGNRASFICVDAPDWVTIIPESGLEDGEMTYLLVRQFRHGNAGVGMEFPAGMVDPGEDPREAAARELLEETGHSAGELIKIGAVSPNPAFMTNTTHSFLARDLKKVASQNLDRHEILDVHSDTYSGLLQKMGKGAFASAITVQAWYFYLRFIKGL